MEKYLLSPATNWFPERKMVWRNSYGDSTIGAGCRYSVHLRCLSSIKTAFDEFSAPSNGVFLQGVSGIECSSGLAVSSDGVSHRLHLRRAGKYNGISDRCVRDASC